MSETLARKAAAEHPAEMKMVRSVEPDELQRMLVSNCGYSADFVRKERVSCLRSFTAYLLHKLRVTSWPQFEQLSSIVRLAAVRMTDFPPPGGALQFFEVWSANVNRPHSLVWMSALRARRQERGRWQWIPQRGCDGHWS